MNMSQGGSSTKLSPNLKKTSKCNACGDIGYFAECKDINSDIEPVKVVHKEVIGLLTVKENPVLSKMRRRGWYLVSRCTVHVCNSRDMFADYHPWNGHEVILDNNEHVDVSGIGTVVLQFTTGKVLTLSNVFHIPAIRKCLVSLVKLTDIEFEILFGAGGVTIMKNQEIVGKGYNEDGLFRLSIIKPDNEPAKVLHKEVIGMRITLNKDSVSSEVRDQGWYMDTRSAVHICNSWNLFTDYHSFTAVEAILDNNEHAEVTGHGTVVLHSSTGKVLKLSNVYHIPAARKCLVAVKTLDATGFKVSFGSEGVIIEKDHEILAEGYEEDGLFRLSIVKPDIEFETLVLNDLIDLITINDDLDLSKKRCGGWYLASRCKVHICYSRDMFADYHPWFGHEDILDNGHHVEVAGIGTVVLRLTTGKVLTLSNVFHIPTSVKCIVSIYKLAENGFKMSFEDEEVIIEKDQAIVGEGYFDGWYQLNIME